MTALLSHLRRLEGLSAPYLPNYLRVRAQGSVSPQRATESATAGATPGVVAW